MRVLGLMAGLTKDPVLGINDIKEKQEIEIDKKHTDKVVLVREEGIQGEREMTPATGNSIHRSGSRPQLDLSKAAIQGNFEERNPTILLPNQSDDISHLALDIGGVISLIFRLFLWIMDCVVQGYLIGCLFFVVGGFVL